uniref:Fibronectin type-III domain-containing protein n=1 Tax=Macrostomum lignano TaxID=282301 RepID=A0A1I8HPN1_9PLAT
LTENSIVVTWQNLNNPDDFVLMYRPRGDTDSGYHRIRLRAYMKRYSISSLRPGCAYQLCLALRTYTDYQHLHCMVVTTLTGRESADRDNLLFNGRIVLVLVIGIAVSVGVLVACLVACSLSRDKETDAWSQASLAGSRWSDSQPMTFENRAAADDYFGDVGDALESEPDEDDDDDSNADQVGRRPAEAAIDGIELRMQDSAADPGEEEFGERLITSVMQHRPLEVAMSGNSEPSAQDKH